MTMCAANVCKLKAKSDNRLKLCVDEQVSIYSDRELTIKHEVLTIDIFSISVKGEFPELAKKKLDPIFHVM